jgi:hypothetical protein
MLSGFDHCRHEGCTQPRKRGTVFCEQHHQEHLRRPPAAPTPAPRLALDPNQLRAQWKRILGWEEGGIITREEALRQLYDFFLHCRVRKSEHKQWEAAALDILSDAIVAELLAHAKSHPARLFGPLSIIPEVRAAQAEEARIARKELIAILEKKSR